MYHQLEPGLDGTYSTSSIRYADALRSRLGALNNSDDHPFVLKGIAQRTRYSDYEKSSITQFCLSKKFNLFDTLGIDESRGDRLLMIGRFKNQFGTSLLQSNNPSAANTDSARAQSHSEPTLLAMEDTN